MGCYRPTNCKNFSIGVPVNREFESQPHLFSGLPPRLTLVANDEVGSYPSDGLQDCKPVGVLCPDCFVLRGLIIYPYNPSLVKMWVVLKCTGISTICWSIKEVNRNLSDRQATSDYSIVSQETCSDLVVIMRDLGRIPPDEKIEVIDKNAKKALQLQ